MDFNKSLNILISVMMTSALIFPGISRMCHVSAVSFSDDTLQRSLNLMPECISRLFVASNFYDRSKITVFLKTHLLGIQELAFIIFRKLKRKALSSLFQVRANIFKQFYSSMQHSALLCLMISALV